MTMMPDPKQLPAKTPIKPPDLYIALVLLTYFLTLGAIQYSIALYTRNEYEKMSIEERQNTLVAHSLLAQFCRWLDAAPVLGIWFIMMALIVPIAIVKQTIDLFQIATKKATRLRHLLDLFNWCFLATLLYTIFGHMLPLKNTLISLCTDPSGIMQSDPRYVSALYELTTIFGYLNIGNAIGWSLPVIRFQHEVVHANIAQPQFHETLRAAQEQQLKQNNKRKTK